MSKKLSLTGYEVEFIPLECRLRDRRVSAISTPPALEGERRSSPGRRCTDALTSQVLKLLTPEHQTV